MIGDLVFDAELAKPPVGQIDLHLRAQPPLRADRKHVTHNQHPDHQNRVDRWTTRVRIVRGKLFVNPTEIENAIDPAHQVIRRHHFVEIEGIKELALLLFPPPHHPTPPLMPVSNQRNHGSRRDSTEFCNTFSL